MSFLGGLGSFGSWLGGIGSKIGNWANNNTGAAAIISHLAGAGAVTDTLAAASAIGNKLGGSSGYSNLEKLAILNAIQQNNASTPETKQSQADVDKGNAAVTGAQSQQQTARNAEKAAINAGLNKSRAASVGTSSAANTYGNTQNANVGSLSSQSAQTQADYLAKMGQAQGMWNEANNMGKSARLAGISGALQGGAAGISMGAAISDENAKKDPIDDDELNRAIKEFKELKARVEELRGRNHVRSCQ